MRDQAGKLVGKLHPQFPSFHVFICAVKPNALLTITISGFNVDMSIVNLIPSDETSKAWPAEKYENTQRNPSPT